MPRRLVVLLVAAMAVSVSAVTTLVPIAPAGGAAPLAPIANSGSSGQLLYANEGNRMHRIDVDSIGTAHLDQDVLVPSHADDPVDGRDVNGEICAMPDGSGRFLAGEDTGQTAVPPGWGLFDASGTQVGKLAATYQSGGAEPHGCEFADDGTLFTADVGFQGFGTANGQLILWFPPFDQFPGAPGTYPNGERSTNYCKLATDLGTAGAVAIDDLGRVYVAESSGLRITRFSPPFPTGPDAAGGCGGVDATGAPVATAVQREVFTTASDNMLTFSGLAFAPNGNLYAASVLTGRIAEYDLDGNLVRFLLEPTETLPPIPSGNPQALAVGNDGSVYYADLDLVGTLPNVGPGPDGTVRRIRMDAHGDPLPPTTVLAGRDFPDGVALFDGDLGQPDPDPYEWPTLAGGDERQFFNPDEHAITPENAADLIERWRFPTGAVVTASPSVATVDIIGRGPTRTVFASSWDRHVYAIDWATGQELWRFEWEDQPGASFPGAGSVTIEQIDGVPIAFFGAGEKVYALDARSGALLWQFAAGTGCRSMTGIFPGLCGFSGERNQVESTPIVVGGTVYVGMDVNDVPLGKGGFYALDARDGTMTWFFDPESGSVCRPDPNDEVRRYDGYHSEPELGLPVGFLSTRSGCGHPRTRYGCGNVWSSASHDDKRGLLFFATSNCDTDADPGTPVPAPPMPPYDEAIVALHLDGTPAWRWRPREVDPDDLAFGGAPNLFSIEVTPGQTRDVVGVGNKDGTYYVVDREGTNVRDDVLWDDPDASGLPYWSTKVVPGGDIGGVIQTASVDEGNRRVLFSTAPGFDVVAAQRPTVHALDMDTGAVLWQNTETGIIDGDASYGPTSATPDVVAVGSVITPHLRLYDAADGTLLVDRNIGEPGSFSGISSGATFLDGTLVVGTGIGSRTSTGSSPGDFAANTPSAVVALCAPGTPGCELPTITPGQASVVEGDAGTTEVAIPVTLSRRYGRQVTVDWATSGGTATIGQDVDDAYGTVTFAPNQTAATITLVVHGDVEPEDDEVALVQLSNPVDAIIGGFDGLGAASILDDDRPVIVPGTVEVVEGDGAPTAVELTVTLSEPSPRTASARFATVDDSAIAPEDHVAATGTVTFAPGETEATISLPIVRDDLDEEDERFFVALTDPIGATIGGFGGLGAVAILDDDTGPAVGVPGAPDAPVASAIDGGAQVEWTRPADTGSSPVTSYRVTAEPGGATCTWTDGPLRCTVTGLANGTPHTFVVHASNDAGPGPSSAPSNAVTPTEPHDTWFTPHTPLRILDSRPSEAIGGSPIPWGEAETRAVDIAGALGGQAPDAVALNITVTDTSAVSYLAAWATGSPRPLASTLNWGPGQTIANATIVPVGPDGTVSVFNAAGQAHVVIDLVGTFTDDAGAGFEPIEPARVLDSRVSGTPLSSPWTAGEQRDLPIVGTGVPSNVVAVAVNVTVTDATADSYLTLWPTGSPRPTTSNLNWPAGDTIANSAIVALGDDGKISIHNNSGDANVIVDVVGYFLATSGDAFHPIAPARVSDSRPPGIGAWSSPWAAATRTVPIAGAGGVPAGAHAVAANVTVVDGTAPSYLTLWPTGSPAPSTSALNWLPGEIIANGATLALGDGSIDVRNHAGSVGVIVDVTGWYG